ncbi:MAG: FAD-dependent oxidoreductase [Clostridiaceae bacterium]|nr:FAD-dependent oxidoreductase [Clostridiaceae bacterium]
MKVIIIGGVAAGTKAAAKIKREDRSAQVEIYTKSGDISYAGCGLPYYVGGEIETREELIVNSPEKFASLTGATVHTRMEAISVNAEAKTVAFRSTVDGSEQEASYDKLIIASGASPIVPNIEGVGLNGVFTVRTPDDAISIRDYIEKNNCKKAVVIGAGFIGMEMAENLAAQKLAVTVVDMTSQILPNILDPEMAGYAAKVLRSNGFKIMTGTAVSAIKGETAVSAVATNAGELAADIVILSIGIRPSTDFLKDTGIEMIKGAIVVDEYQKTALDDIYAVGDCAVVKNRISGEAQWSAMGSTANITARCLAKTLTGENTAYGGCLGTGVVKLSDNLSAGRTGLSEEQAVRNGYNVITAVCVGDDKAHYYPDSSTFVTKLIADKATGKLLGMQVLGSGAVDKMTDIAVVGISAGLKVGDFDTMDMAYAPPFSTAIHPFVQACYVLQNKMSGDSETFTPAEYLAGKAKDYRVIDVQPEAKIFGATWVNLGKVNGEIEGIGKAEKLLLVCAKGKRGYFLQNRLKYYGYTNTKVLEGGAFFNTVKVENPAGKLSPEEIKRVKGLGCLQDKRYTDVFNVRVITKNGKISASEQHIIAEAAEKFGSGEVTMTSRLTLEIQGVHYADIEELIAYLNENGLITGGTGSLVRPVVSCKGTTCQYGLIDTFGLSEKIHERFYLGYHGVTLPHKFKIAVGGCPNNCVKPDLNDLGIIGQRIPVIDAEKCKGCKKCQVENACPIKAAKLEDGKLVINADCNNCGRCKSKCPFGVIPEYTDGYKIYIGGRWGKKYANGRPLEKIFTSEEDVMDVVESAILFFRDEGISGERFADTIKRLGFDYVQDKLINNRIDKTAVLNKTVKGGATC